MTNVFCQTCLLLAISELINAITDTPMKATNVTQFVATDPQPNNCRSGFPAKTSITKPVTRTIIWVSPSKKTGTARSVPKNRNNMLEVRASFALWARSEIKKRSNPTEKIKTNPPTKMVILEYTDFRM